MIAATILAAASGLGGTTPTAAQEAVLFDQNGRAVNPVPTPPPPVVPSALTPEVGEADTIAVAEAGDASDAVRTQFASLSDAVDAHRDGDLDDELMCLATGIYYESKGEPLAGQLAVADVIINRSQSGRFPGSVCAVLTQRGQFSFVRNGRLPSVKKGSRAWKTAVAVARVARREAWESPTDGALFFHASYVSPGWRLAKVGQVGNHVFYR